MSPAFARGLVRAAHALGALRGLDRLGDRFTIRLGEGSPRIARRVRGRYLVLIYHRVNDAPSPFMIDCVPTALFDGMMAYLARHFDVIGLGEIVDRLRAEEPLPPRAVAITFDDGYEDNYLHAFPVLKARGLEAAFFVTAGLVERPGALWFDEVLDAFERTPLAFATLPGRAEPADLGGAAARLGEAHRVLEALKPMPDAEKRAAIAALRESLGVAPSTPSSRLMRWEQIREMAEAGMEIGSHTLTHAILSRVPEPQAEREIVESKRLIEARISRPVRLFAYPNGKPGDYTAANIAMLDRAGFVAAVTTSPGANAPEVGLFRMRRVRSLWDGIQGFAASLSYHHLLEGRA